MATPDRSLRRVPRRQKRNSLPAWAIVMLVGVLAVLVYGLMVPKTPSAFDRPEAQVNQPGPPWSQRGY